MKIHVPILNKTRKNCFRYLKLMSPLNAAICTTTYLERQKCYGPGKKILFKFFLFDLEVKGHYSMWHTALWSCTHIPNKYYLKNNYLTLRSKVITVRDTPPYGHAPTYQISLTYLERRKCYGPDKKILFKKQLFDLEVKGQGPTNVITVRDTILWSCTHIPNIIDLSWKTKMLWPGQENTI